MFVHPWIGGLMCLMGGRDWDEKDFRASESKVCVCVWKLVTWVNSHPAITSMDT